MSIFSRPLSPVRVSFSREGWRQFCKVNSSLGARFIRAYVLKHELETYLAAHEAAGVQMDTVCQEVRYDDGIVLVLQKTQGVWQVTDVVMTGSLQSFVPVFFVKRAFVGCMTVLKLVFTGWLHLFGKADRKKVIV